MISTEEDAVNAATDLPQEGAEDEAEEEQEVEVEEEEEGEAEDDDEEDAEARGRGSSRHDDAATDLPPGSDARLSGD